MNVYFFHDLCMIDPSDINLLLRLVLIKDYSEQWVVCPNCFRASFIRAQLKTSVVQTHPPPHSLERVLWFKINLDTSQVVLRGRIALIFSPLSSLSIGITCKSSKRACEVFTPSCCQSGQVFPTVVIICFINLHLSGMDFSTVTKEREIYTLPSLYIIMVHSVHCHPTALFELFLIWISIQIHFFRKPHWTNNLFPLFLQHPPNKPSFDAITALGSCVKT